MGVVSEWGTFPYFYVRYSSSVAFEKTNKIGPNVKKSFFIKSKIVTNIFYRPISIVSRSTSLLGLPRTQRTDEGTP